MFFPTIKSNLLWTQSPFIVISLALAGLIGVFFWMPLFYLAVILFLFVFYFFRNPERECVDACALTIICPADGKVVAIDQVTGKKADEFTHKISIFLSPLDVHVNWIPISGTIQKVQYVPGTFMMAFLPKSSELNEHNDIEIAHASNQKILVRQIAGTVARRIVCWVKPTEAVCAGQKFGMIKFSSRIDIFFPAGTFINVKLGQKVYGGTTILGRLP